jgi:hypothetical protein
MRTVGAMDSTSMHRSHVRDEVAHLHELEVEGESAATPVVALVEVVLFLIPVLVLIAAVTFAAYYLGA